MKRNSRNEGSVLLMVVFIIAVLSTLVVGMLQVDTEEIQLMQNHIYAAEAIAIAQAGLNDAFREIRLDNEWDSGFSDKSFWNGSYSVEVDDSTITVTAANQQNFAARIEAQITVSAISPYIIRIDNYKVNE